MQCIAERAQLLAIDVQEKFLPAMHDGETLIANMRRLIGGARLLGASIAVTEHYVRGLGPTVAPLREAVEGAAPFFEKITFSAARNEAVARHVAGVAGEGRRQIVICGIETHVCILQTALDFTAMNYDVVVVADAVTARAERSTDIALRRLEQSGVTLATTEMILFEWLERADRAEFKAIARSIR